MHILMGFHGQGFDGNSMHMNRWKLRCFNACKALKQCLMMVTTCRYFEGWLHGWPQRHHLERVQNKTR